MPRHPPAVSGRGGRCPAPPPPAGRPSGGRRAVDWSTEVFFNKIELYYGTIYSIVVVVVLVVVLLQGQTVAGGRRRTASGIAGGASGGGEPEAAG
eukprot:SAG31_NODE_186_length_20918_cov_26.890917_12_plen_95_part_00